MKVQSCMSYFRQSIHTYANTSSEVMRNHWPWGVNSSNTGSPNAVPPSYKFESPSILIVSPSAMIPLPLSMISIGHLRMYPFPSFCIVTCP